MRSPPPPPWRGSRARALRTSTTSVTLMRLVCLAICFLPILRQWWANVRHPTVALTPLFFNPLATPLLDRDVRPCAQGDTLRQPLQASADPTRGQRTRHR